MVSNTLASAPPGEPVRGYLPESAVHGDLICMYPGTYIQQVSETLVARLPNEFYILLQICVLMVVDPYKIIAREVCEVLQPKQRG